LEMTCLEACGGLERVVVTPRRLVVSAAVSLRWGRAAPGWGPLPGYLHWRQFRSLDLAIALNLNDANAGELLTATTAGPLENHAKRQKSSSVRFGFWKEGCSGSPQPSPPKTLCNYLPGTKGGAPGQVTGPACKVAGAEVH